MAGLGPRVLQVLEFARARAPELQALQELAQHDEVATAADAKVQTQRNQRRRRANAFKSHQMPQRLRAKSKNKNKSKLKGAERCRQHERRPHKLQISRSWPSEGAPQRAVWLASHMWHAKRFKMAETFGHVLAARRADKGVSAALQAVRSKATLHDASHYGVIELYGLPQVILEALQLVSDPSGSDFHGLKFLAGSEEGHSMLYHEGMFPKGAIAPVTFMWRPLKADYAGEAFELHEDWQNTKRQLWIWVHPAAYMEAAAAIGEACQAVVGDEEEGIQMLDRRGQLCRLKLRGRLADELVASLADHKELNTNVEDQDMEENTASDHEDGFPENDTVIACKNSNRHELLRALRQSDKKVKSSERVETIYSVAVNDPRLACWRDGSLSYKSEPTKSNLSLLQEPPGTAVPQVGAGVIKSPLSGLTLSSRGENAEEPESEIILKDLQALLSWTTNNPSATASEKLSVTYPHSAPLVDPKTSDAIGVEKCSEHFTAPSSLLWSLSKRSKLGRNFVQDHKQNERIYRQRKESKFVVGSEAASVESQPVHLLVVRKRNPYPHTSGWDIICPPVNVPSLLKALVFGGALVLGLEEDYALSTVVHQPSFPCDFPDTQAGQQYWEERASEFETEQAKKPKSKRINFAKHGVASPFQPGWSALFSAQTTEGDTEEADQTLCVLRGGEYMEPFCFYSASPQNNGSEATSSFTPATEDIVPVPMPTLVRVVIAFPRRGNVAINSMLFAPSDEDRNQFYCDSSWQGCSIDLSKKNKTKDPQTDKRALIGYVTSAVYDRPKAAFRAVGFCACEPLQQIFLANQSEGSSKKSKHALAMLQTPQGRMLRPVLIQAEV